MMILTARVHGIWNRLILREELLVLVLAFQFYQPRLLARCIDHEQKIGHQVVIGTLNVTALLPG